MKLFKTAITTLLIASTSMVAVSSQAVTMTPHMEKALIQACKAAASNKTGALKRTLKAYRLNEKTVALTAVCNGEDIIEFAQNRGAEKTATHMSKKIGNASITDIKIAKNSVNF